MYLKKNTHAPQESSVLQHSQGTAKCPQWGISSVKSV